MSNVIEVELTKRSQPVRIWGVDFEIKEGQKFRVKILEDVQRLRKYQEKSEKAIDKAVAALDFKALEKIENDMSKEVKSVADSIFGEGAYESLYAIEGDADYILEAVAEVISRYTELQTQQQGNAYLTGKRG